MIEDERRADNAASCSRSSEPLSQTGLVRNGKVKPVEGRTETYTVAEACEAVGLGKFQWALLFYAGLAWLSDAMEMMIISLLGPAVRCEWGLSTRQESAISTLVFVGTLIGANAFGALSDAYGRRAGFFVTAVFTFVFGVASALAPSFAWLLVMRFLVGIGLGGAHVPVALYMEFVPTKYRGVMLVALQSFWTVGTMIEAGLGWVALTPLGWRWLLAISSIPLLILALLYPLIPESPLWLSAVGRTKDAEKVLAKVAAVNGRPLPPGHLHHKEPDDLQGGGVVSDLKVLWHNIASTFTKALALTTSLLMIIWCSNALIYYSEVLLITVIQATKAESVCGSDHRLRLSNDDMRDVFVTSFAELPGLILAALLIDVIGRKRTMFVALSIIFVATGLLVVSPSYRLVKLFLSRAASMGGFTTLFIYTPEVYPTRVRSFALGLNNSMSRIGAILSPLIAVNLGAGGHLQAAEVIITVICGLAACCVLGLPYETSGKSLEALDENLKSRRSGVQGDEEAQTGVSSAEGPPGRGHSLALEQVKRPGTSIRASSCESANRQLLRNLRTSSNSSLS